MASFKVEGFNELALSFDKLANIPTNVIAEMLNAEADVIVRAQKATAKAMLNGKFSTGKTADSISKAKAIVQPNGGNIITVYAMGTRTRGKKSKTRNSEIAFVNEYGARGKPKRPFIAEANKKHADEAVAAATAVYDKYLGSI
ncbi:MAG: hypothetical protein LBT12_01545 [Oscillospiraceae bacterium]|jgi:HK97 gp10 family phage protein|nr:hypothetical protein [Oscillospiraceae bacterium]